MTDTPSRILFVDDEARVLRGLRRTLLSERRRWEMEFVDSGPAALARLAQVEFDAVVSDIRMAPMDGVELLRRVRSAHPRLVRLVLSGQCDEEQSRLASETAHQVLSKPCEVGTLRRAVEDAWRMQRELVDPALSDFVAALGPIADLPAQDDTLAAELEASWGDPKRAAELLGSATTTADRILEVANCELGTGSGTLDQLEHACARLGRVTLSTVYQALRFFEQFDPMPIADSWSHAVRTGLLAKRLVATASAQPFDPQHALLAGLLHDCGQVAMAARYPDRYEEVWRRAPELQDLCAAEREVFGVDHARVGGQLLSRWMMPEPVVRAVAFHHDPQTLDGSRVGPLAATHVADSVVAGETPHTGCLFAEIDPDYVEALGIKDGYEDLLRIVEHQRG